MLERLSEPGQGIFEDPPQIDLDHRLIRMVIPADMHATDSLGFSREGSVDERFMPEEAVAKGNRIELTDQAQVINQAIDAAKMEERSWPTVQYLWEGHPILDWFADRADVFFSGHAAPVASLRGRLESGEIAVVLHGAIPNEKGAPVVDRWAVVILKPDNRVVIEEVETFMARTRLAEDTPNGSLDDTAGLPDMVRRAVDVFQDHLVELRKVRKAEITADMDRVLDRLGAFEGRFKKQLSLSFADLEGQDLATNASTKRRLSLRQAKEGQIDQLFKDWTEWFEATRQMVEDPNPYVDVKAVFVG